MWCSPTPQTVNTAPLIAVHLAIGSVLIVLRRDRCNMVFVLFLVTHWNSVQVLLGFRSTGEWFRFSTNAFVANRNLYARQPGWLSEISIAWINYFSTHHLVELSTKIDTQPKGLGYYIARPLHIDLGDMIKFSTWDKPLYSSLDHGIAPAVTPHQPIISLSGVFTIPPVISSDSNRETAWTKVIYDGYLICIFQLKSSGTVVFSVRQEARIGLVDKWNQKDCHLKSLSWIAPVGAIYMRQRRDKKKN